MYEIGRRVFVKPADTEGRIDDRGWTEYEGKRHAFYGVTFTDLRGNPLGKGIYYSRELVALDYWCDHCGKARSGVPAAAPRDHEGYVVVEYCFLCYLELRGY